MWKRLRFSSTHHILKSHMCAPECVSMYVCIRCILNPQCCRNHLWLPEKIFRIQILQQLFQLISVVGFRCIKDGLQWSAWKFDLRSTPWVLSWLHSKVFKNIYASIMLIMLGYIPISLCLRFHIQHSYSNPFLCRSPFSFDLAVAYLNVSCLVLSSYYHCFAFLSCCLGVNHSDNIGFDQEGPIPTEGDCYAM